MFHRFTCILLLFMTASMAAAQDNKQSQADLVKAVILGQDSKDADVQILLRSLVSIKGRILIAGEDSFDIRFKTKGGKRTSNSIKYRDVLYLKSKEKVISSIPSVDARPHGEWDDINKIYPGTRVVVVLEGERTFEGWSNSATAEKLIVLNEKASETVEFRRAEVIAVYGMLAGYGGVKKNASKASEGMSSSGGNQLLGGALVGVAALLGMIKSDGRPILVNSR